MGQAPDRQAALFAGLPKSVPCTAVNKVKGWANISLTTFHRYTNTWPTPGVCQRYEGNHAG